MVLVVFSRNNYRNRGSKMKIKEKVLKEIKENWNNETQIGYSQQAVDDTVRRTLIEADKEFIRRTKKGICLICKKKDDFSKEIVCGNCSLRWLEKKGKLKDYIKRTEVGKVIDESKIIKDEICQCGCSKKAHMPHQLDKNGGRCGICVNCPIYTWKSFEFVDLKELKKEIGI